MEGSPWVLYRTSALKFPTVPIEWNMPQYILHHKNILVGKTLLDADIDLSFNHI